MYEIFYSYGGHCGPYKSIGEAILAAYQRIRGSHRLDWVQIKVATSTGYENRLRINRDEVFKPEYVI